MKNSLFLFLCLLAITAKAANPSSAIFGNFCVNQTSNTITFTADVTNLYNVTNPATQWSTIGTHLAYPTLPSQLACTSLSVIETSLPETVPQPIQTFVSDINKLNVYNFIFPGITQNTYQPLNPEGPVAAVQMINDYTTGNVLKMRFFYKINLAALQNCTGTSFEGSTNGQNNVTIFKSVIPVNILSRDSAGRVQQSTGGIVIVASRETAGSDLVLSVSEGSSLYNFDTFLEKAVIENTGCSAGQSRAVLTVGMAYTAGPTSGLTLVQGPLSAADVSIVQNPCYNFSVVKFTRPVCSSNSSCLAQIQVATLCRPSSRSFLTCPSNTESSLLNLEVQARECTGTRTRPRNCTTGGSAVSNGQDGVSSSIDFASSISPLYALNAYNSPTSLLTNPLSASSTLNSSTVVVVALMAQGPENAAFLPLAINTSALVFNLYTASNSPLLLGASYSQLRTAGLITNGVKANNQQQLLIECGALDGCDSFALNKTTLTLAYPSVALAGISGVAPNNAPAAFVPQSITVAVVEMITYPDRRPWDDKVIKGTFGILGGLAAAVLISGIIVIAVYAPTAGLEASSATLEETAALTA